MRSSLVDLETRNDELTEDLHCAIHQIHKLKLQRVNGKEESQVITSNLNKALAERSPTHQANQSGVNVDKLVRHLENWKKRLEIENESLRATIASLQAEVCGARLSARYLDKELAGRIQQLQLAGRTDMVAAVKDRLWAQLEAEILVQRQKTVVRAVRQRDTRAPSNDILNTSRTVVLKRDNNSLGLGISITGGREHGVPILISELEPGGGTEQLYVGDAVLEVNGIDLTQVSHNEAVKILSNQIGEVKLKVKYVGQDDTEEDSDISHLRYGFFNDGNHVNYENGYNKEVTPTAPRTPDSSVRDISDESSYASSPRTSDVQEIVDNAKTNSQAVKAEPISPMHIGVTTLQKIFRTLSPSGPWKDQQDSPTPSSDRPSPESLELQNHQNHQYQIQQIQNSQHVQKHHQQHQSKTVTTFFNDTYVSSKMSGKTKERHKSDKQVYCPEVNNYVDGVGDASFGTPV
ncbi:Golgi-associated PDZ and coiled-coil motif containing [Nesidiocoris tenuis]|uniref:Golgi-associated PDZ and coiled-coil motif containing n=1 Tax=Nesidiocoris tenuis TaxID=355587 RepID=A0ABN7B9X0_9HEMI|nr:Golgi-associated PDZ and coiled-coil motif containing [Nesidiocoris tenuis]